MDVQIKREVTCPYCGADKDWIKHQINYDLITTLSLQEGEASQDWRCIRCGRSWRETYLITAQQVTEITSPDPASEEDIEVWRKVRKNIKEVN